MITPFRTAITLFVAALLACASALRPGEAPRVRAEFYVQVENQGTDAIALYQIRSGTPFRVGYVEPGRTEMFRLDATLSPDAFCLRASLRREVWCTDRVLLQANSLLDITAAFNLRQSSFMVTQLRERPGS